MAELGRARPTIVAAISVLLTANISLLSFDRADAVRTAAAKVARSTTTVIAPPPGHIVFGKRDTVFGRPTVFSVRPDGSGLSPSARPPARTEQPLRNISWGNDSQGVFSHDGTRFAAVGRDVWIVRVEDGKATKLTSNVTSVRPAQPVWSPDDAHIAFVWQGNIVVMKADGSHVRVAYRAPTDVNEVEHISLFDWTAAERH